MELDTSVRSINWGTSPPREFRYQTTGAAASNYGIEDEVTSPGGMSKGPGDPTQYSCSDSFPSLAAPLSSDQQYIRSVSHVGFYEGTASPETEPMDEADV